jgi:hypothetical protein
MHRPDRASLTPVLLQPRRNAVTCRLGRDEQVVNVPVRLEVDEPHHAIIVVDGYQRQAAVASCPVHLLRSRGLRGPGGHLGGGVTR